MMTQGKTTYFRSGTFHQDDPEMDAFVQKWYGSHLESMDEPVIHAAASPETVIYRFLCLPTFDSPFALRVQSESDGSTLIVKSTNGKGGYYPGELTLNECISLTSEGIRKTEQAILRADFWSFETSSDDGGLDGTRFILEVMERDRYHVVSRWCPSKNAFRKLCDHFVAVCPGEIRKHLNTEC